MPKNLSIQLCNIVLLLGVLLMPGCSKDSTASSKNAAMQPTVDMAPSGTTKAEVQEKSRAPDPKGGPKNTTATRNNSVLRITADMVPLGTAKREVQEKFGAPDRTGGSKEDGIEMWVYYNDLSKLPSGEYLGGLKILFQNDKVAKVLPIYTQLDRR